MKHAMSLSLNGYFFSRDLAIDGKNILPATG
jgi:hypothetical protein